MGEFVPFLLKVDEYVLRVGEFVIFPFPFFRFVILTHFLFPFHPLADVCTCRFNLLADFIHLHFS